MVQSTTARRIHGYTIVEILIVLAVLALLTLIAIPWFVKISQRNALKSAAREIQITLTAARMTAVKRNAPVSVVFASLTPPMRMVVIEPQPPAPTPTIRAPEFLPAERGAHEGDAGDRQRGDHDLRRRRTAADDGHFAGSGADPPDDDRGRSRELEPAQRDSDRDERAGLRQGRHAGGLAMSTPTLRIRTLRRRESGVTLVEMLIATFLLALILLSIAPLFITSVKANYSANEYTSIHNIARDKLEQLMSLPPTDLQLRRDVTGNKGLTDLPPTLPDPLTGIPSASTPRNTLVMNYTVRLFTNQPPATGAKWILNEVVVPTDPYDFKQIDVTVSAVASQLAPFPQATMGFGNRTARVSGFIRNPTPGTGDPP